MKKILSTLGIVVITGFLAVGCGNAQANPQPESANRLSEDAVKAIVFSDAKLTSDDISHISILYDTEEGIPQYSVEFYYGDMEYDYEIDARTGDIIKKLTESVGYDSKEVAGAVTDATQQQPAQTQQNQAPAQTQQNQAPAQTQQNQAPAQTQQNPAPAQTQQNQAPAQDAVSQATQQQPAQTQQPQEPISQPANTNDIGLEQAKSIALSQVPGATAANIVKAKKDFEDDWGYYEYEIEIIYGQMEYEFEIRATDGVITSRDQESIYD